MLATVYKNSKAAIVEIEKPSIKNNEVLVKVCASSICQSDNNRRKNGKESNLATTGLEFSGTIASVGTSVNNFSKGNDVFGMLNIFGGARAHAEYVAVPESFIWHKPANISFEEAASLPISLLTSFEALIKIGKLKAKQEVLINGASGGVGVYAVKLAKALGASVTAVCSSRNAETVKSLNADKIICYDQKDFTALAEAYDIIFDVANNQSFKKCKAKLNPKGIYISTNPFNDLMGFVHAFFSGKKAGYLLVSKGNSRDLQKASAFIENNSLTPFLDRTFKFEEMNEAYDHFESGKKKGRVIIRF